MCVKMFFCGKSVPFDLYNKQTLILLGLYTALRIGDILQLKWRMVYDFNKHHFFDHIYVNEQKTQKLNVIALNQHVKASLIVYFEIRNPEPEDYIFTKRTTVFFLLSDLIYMNATLSYKMLHFYYSLFIFYSFYQILFTPHADSYSYILHKSPC